VSDESWYLKKTLVLSPNAMGISELDMIDDYVLEKVLQKCGKYLSQIIYNDIYKLRQCIEYKLVGYIATYCSNLTSLHLTASHFIPLEIEILAKNCKMIKELQLTLNHQYMYEDELTKLFEQNKNLETLALYNMDYICPSLMQLPEHKMKVITLKCMFDFKDILQSVSIIQFFLYLVFIIGMHVDHKCNMIYSRIITDTKKTTKLEVLLDNYIRVKRFCIRIHCKILQKSGNLIRLHL